MQDVFYLDQVTAGLENTEAVGTLVFRNVNFAGGIRIVGVEIPVAVRFEQVRALFIKTKDVDWLRKVEFLERCEIGRASFEGGSFRGSLVISNSRFASAYFKRVHFQAPLKLLHNVILESSFSGSQFWASAAFDGTVFEETAKFFATEFNNDVSFAEVETKGSILFQRVEFKGDAEFSHCQINEADFGREWTTIFSGLADFRECTFGKASFDATVFQGRATFAGAHFGGGGVSFENARFAGKESSIEGVIIQGPLWLGAASASALRFDWDEIEKPVLDANPKPRVLDAIRTRLTELGEEEAARKVRYWLAHRARLEKLSSNRVSKMQKLSIQVKYLIWDLPTAYGAQPWLYVSVLATFSGVVFILIIRMTKRRHPHASPAPIFISYRRAVAAADARLIHEELESQGIEAFMDIDDIGLGPFPAQLSEAVFEAKVMLVVIGPGWADIADDQSERRLDDPEDWVRREISLGIENGALIVPVLVREAPMPIADNLPPEIRPLVDYQAVSLRIDAWKRDFAHLLELLTQNDARTRSN